MTGARLIALPALLLAALLGLWETFVDLGGADPLLLPAPHAVARALYDDRALLWSSFLVTGREIALGIALGIVVALICSVGIHFSELARRAVYPLLVASQAVPIPLIAPLLLAVLGFAILPKLAIIALVAFFPVVVTTLAALAAVDRDLIKLMRTFDASRLQIFRRVELPSALPALLTGAKLAAVYSAIAAVFAEQAGSNSGLGYLFIIAYNQLLVPEAYAAVTVLSLTAIALFALLTAIERWALPWAHPPKGEPDR